jgi:hypothetical protein
MSCTPPQEATCAVTATREITFTQADAADTVTTRSFGESCAHAIGLFTIAASDGAPVWAWAAPLARQFGDDFAADSESMRAFLERWGDPEIATTGAAPEWAQLAPGQTTLDQLTYSDIRARNLPMLCHYSGTARQVCVFWEPAAASAGLFLERDVEEGEPR